MKKSRRILIIAICAIALAALIILLMFTGYFDDIVLGKPKPILSDKIQLEEGEKFKDIENNQEYQNFKTECNKAGGEAVTSLSSVGSGGGGGGGSIVNCNCYPSFGGTDKSCGSDSECDSRNCNFEEAISSGACILTKTDKNLEEGTYTYYYACDSTKPATCSSLPRDAPRFYMEGTTLVEQGIKEFPQEEMEFRPV